MFNSRVDGLLVCSVENTKTSDHFDAFLRKKIPVIFFDRVMALKDCMNILIDNRKAAYEATSYLIEQGCRKIVHITAVPKTNIYIDRLQGYKDALKDHHISFKSEHIIISNFSQESA